MKKAMCTTMNKKFVENGENKGGKKLDCVF